jgi:pyruvate,orthophosphate dikinase
MGGSSALVARQMGRPCVAGCRTLAVDAGARMARYGDATIGEGDWISIDGDAGAVYLGRADIVRERPAAELAELERWRSETALAPHHRRAGSRKSRQHA